MTRGRRRLTVQYITVRRARQRCGPAAAGSGVASLPFGWRPPEMSADRRR